MAQGTNLSQPLKKVCTPAQPGGKRSNTRLFYAQHSTCPANVPLLPGSGSQTISGLPAKPWVHCQVPLLSWNCAGNQGFLRRHHGVFTKKSTCPKSDIKSLNDMNVLGITLLCIWLWTNTSWLTPHNHPVPDTPVRTSNWRRKKSQNCRLGIDPLSICQVTGCCCL